MKVLNRLALWAFLLAVGTLLSAAGCGSGGDEGGSGEGQSQVEPAPPTGPVSPQPTVAESATPIADQQSTDARQASSEATEPSKERQEPPDRERALAQFGGLGGGFGGGGLGGFGGGGGLGGFGGGGFGGGGGVHISPPMKFKADTSLNSREAEQKKPEKDFVAD